VTVVGEVYTWGDNDEGQLGDGTTNAIQKPRLVAALQGLSFNSLLLVLAVYITFSIFITCSAFMLLLLTQVEHQTCKK